MTDTDSLDNFSLPTSELYDEFALEFIFRLEDGERGAMEGLAPIGELPPSRRRVESYGLEKAVQVLQRDVVFCAL